MELSSKAFIVHDASGQIVSVGRAVVNIRGKVGVQPTQPGHSVLEVDLDYSQASMSVADLHKNHRVDVASKKLVKK
jgi:hypothetical protein